MLHLPMRPHAHKSTAGVKSTRTQASTILRCVTSYYLRRASPRILSVHSYIERKEGGDIKRIQHWQDAGSCCWACGDLVAVRLGFAGAEVWITIGLRMCSNGFWYREPPLPRSRLSGSGSAESSVILIGLPPMRLIGSIGTEPSPGDRRRSPQIGWSGLEDGSQSDREPANCQRAPGAGQLQESPSRSSRF